MINVDTRLLKQVDERQMWLLLHLAKRINIKGKICWPSNKTLCTDTGWHIEKLQAVKKSLITEGLIEVTARPDKTNIYKINSQKISIYINAEDVEFEESTPVGKTDIPVSEKPLEPILENPTTNRLTNEVLVIEQHDLATQVIGIIDELKRKYNPKASLKPLKITTDRKRAVRSCLKKFKEQWAGRDFIKACRYAFEYKAKEWASTIMWKHFVPETLFSHFVSYLEQAEQNNGTPPVAALKGKDGAIIQPVHRPEGTNNQEQMDVIAKRMELAAQNLPIQ